MLYSVYDLLMGGPTMAELPGCGPRAAEAPSFINMRLADELAASGRTSEHAQGAARAGWQSSVKLVSVSTLSDYRFSAAGSPQALLSPATDWLPRWPHDARLAANPSSTTFTGQSSPWLHG